MSINLQSTKLLDLNICVTLNCVVKYHVKLVLSTCSLTYSCKFTTF